MNTYNLSLSSNTTNFTSHVKLLEFQDYTKLNIDLSGISDTIIPVYVKIDWGLGDVVELYDNNIYRTGRDNVNALNFSPVLTNLYSNEYKPSSYALYKSLSAQVLVNYTNGDNNWFVIPIKIRTYDYFESLGDLKILNTNILPISGNPVEYQLESTINKQLIEMISY